MILEGSVALKEVLNAASGSSSSSNNVQVKEILLRLAKFEEHRDGILEYVKKSAASSSTSSSDSTASSPPSSSNAAPLRVLLTTNRCVKELREFKTIGPNTTLCAVQRP